MDVSLKHMIEILILNGFYLKQNNYFQYEARFSGNKSELSVGIATMIFNPDLKTCIIVEVLNTDLPKKKIPDWIDARKKIKKYLEPEYKCSGFYVSE